MIGPFMGGYRWLAGRGIAALIFGVATLVWPDISLTALVILWGAYALVDGVAALWAAIADRSIEHRGWVAFQGVAGVAAGVVTFVWPSITALALLWVIAAWAIAMGIALIATSIAVRKEISGELLVGLAGVLSVILGVILIAEPAGGALAVTWAIGWFACLYGIVMLTLSWEIRQETKGIARWHSERSGSGAHAH